MFVRRPQFFALGIWIDSIIILSLHSQIKTVQVWKSIY